jgi:hypothetical protein
LKDKFINLDNDKKEEDLLLEKKLESSSKDINTSLQERLIKVKKEDLTKEIQQATILDTR